MVRTPVRSPCQSPQKTTKPRPRRLSRLAKNPLEFANNGAGGISLGHKTSLLVSRPQQFSIGRNQEQQTLTLKTPSQPKLPKYLEPCMSFASTFAATYVATADCQPGADSSPLLAFAAICGVDVKAKTANKNVCTGVVFGVHPTFDRDTLAQNIESSAAPIVASSRSGRKLVVKFAGSAAPSEVALFIQRRPVRPRRPRRLQCTNCGKYGHVAATCTEQPRRLRCGDAHSTADCKAPHPKCINCSGRHIATEPRCPRWQQERKVAEIMAASPQPISRRQAASVAKKQKQIMLRPNPSPKFVRVHTFSPDAPLVKCSQVNLPCRQRLGHTMSLTRTHKRTS
ncbi:hypothetical protein HPB49_003765 [Dermacentor silvarum]|uniref:Uncharacterized protein n=1 Tax=Dermacentor silvarum TaxID=543639 RepID=A0ACB8DTV5_DERSI|nr:hypothetical protein HPB49_003765 [Dermacentor silvarum]